ncbi:hypothetical protein XM47_12935 [Catenovulum maritimum]|uniref:Uncharacterized protein n=1 Tax=Catenovulum maritimum TaxID=1513271 RepID=A0A0J8GTW5_9ALTE|nr:hypothetical protein XM47_12935 [Catenovulum maritimum]
MKRIFRGNTKTSAQLAQNRQTTQLRRRQACWRETRATPKPSAQPTHNARASIAPTKRKP